jgi:hypothetical protein
MKLRRNQYCPIHRSLSCCGREPVPKGRGARRPGVQCIEDPHHPRGYGELRSKAEMRKLVDRKIVEQNRQCAICQVAFFFLSLGSTAIYTYTPDLYPTEIRATAMGIASALGRVGAVTMLLVFGHLFAIHGKSLLFLIIDPILMTASIVVLYVGPPTRGKPLQEV